MKTSKQPEQLMNDFLVYWQSKVKKGIVSPMDRGEILAIKIFANWLCFTNNKKAKKAGTKILVSKVQG